MRAWLRLPYIYLLIVCARVVSVMSRVLADSGLRGLATWFHNLKHDIVRRPLLSLAGDPTQSLSPDALPGVVTASEKNHYWFYWADGLDSAPEVVGKCFRSAEMMLAGEVRVLDRSTLADFVEIEHELAKKYCEGVISETHFSDLVRLRLLSDFGGVWVDATLFFSGPVRRATDPDAARWVETVRRSEASAFGNVSAQRWTTFLLGGSAGHPAWLFSYRLLSSYWSRYSKLSDYHLFDYILDLAWRDPMTGFAFDIERGTSFFDRDLYGLMGLAKSGATRAEILNYLASSKESVHKLDWRWLRQPESAKELLAALDTWLETHRS